MMKRRTKKNQVSKVECEACRQASSWSLAGGYITPPMFEGHVLMKLIVQADEDVGDDVKYDAVWTPSLVHKIGNRLLELADTPEFFRCNPTKNLTIAVAAIEHQEDPT